MAVDRSGHDTRELFEVTVRHSTKGHVTLRLLDALSQYPPLHHHLHSYHNRHHNGSSRLLLEDILWPPDRPLPYPAWGAVQARLFIPNMEQFQGLLEAVTARVQAQLEEHSYNTIGNFLT